VDVEVRSLASGRQAQRVAARWPVIGRRLELARIAEARGAGAGTSAVVVQAAVGVGKSRLAREALAQAGRAGAYTVWAQATRSAASVPLGAFAAMIPVHARAHDRIELLGRITRAMCEAAGKRRLVVGVDDGQLLDPTSAELVLHLARSATAFVVATVRSGEPCPDPIVSLWKDLEAPRLELRCLGETDAAWLLEAMLGGPVEYRVGARIWETSRGNPLYIRELVLGALASGALERVDGLWRMRAPLPLSNSLTELVSARLSGLGDAERQTLELLALGEPLFVSELAELAGNGSLAGVEERGLIEIEGFGRQAKVRLAHPLYGEAVRASLGALRAHRTRLQLSGIVEARRHLTPDLALRVARWLLDAGEPVPSRRLLDAARAANLSGDPALGGQLAQQAVEAGAGLDAALVLARSHSIRNQPERAHDALVAVEGSIETQGDAVAYLDQRTSVLHSGVMRTEELLELLSRWQHRWPEDEGWRARLAPWRLWVSLSRAFEDRNDLVSKISELIRDRRLDRDGRRRLEAIQLVALYYIGRGREAHQLACRIRPGPPLRDPVDETILSIYVNATAETGEGLDELERWAAATLKEAVALGDRGAAGLASLALAHRRLLDGRFADARRWLAEAQLHQEEHDPIGFLAITSGLQAWGAACTRDRAAAKAALERCRDVSSGSDPHGVQRRALQIATASVSLAHGEAAQARRILIDAAAEHRGLPLYAARFLYEAMRAGEPSSEVAPALIELSNRCDARLPAARAAHARHLASRDARALLETANRFHEIGARLYASEAAADAAQLFVEQGRQDSARRAAARSRELFVAGQGRPFPVIEGVDIDPIELTPRESELVELARVGLANGEIAERLGLSKRTVESHIYHAMQKLAISDRRELLT
jgi:DNA-binding NarL/FixJ family response regulator